MGIEIKKVDEKSVEVHYTKATGQGEQRITVTVPIRDSEGAFEMNLGLGFSGLPSLILTTLYGIEANDTIDRAVRETFPDQIVPDAQTENEIIVPVLQTLFMYALQGETLTL